MEKTACLGWMVPMFPEASLAHLFLPLAPYNYGFLLQGATAVAGAGITQSICLPLLSVYQLSSNGTGQVSAALR